jgi:hypothetical protein
MGTCYGVRAALGWRRRHDGCGPKRIDSAQGARGIHHRSRRAVYRFAMSRQCSRTGCAQQAAVTLTYQYGRAQVWIDDLSVERDPHDYDLCDRHAAKLSVPNGWRLEDRRVRRLLVVPQSPRLAG